MSCPYFEPAEAREYILLPLGADWAGLCRARANEEYTPDPSVLRTLCNLGYAAGQCTRFPSANGADAVRFSIVSDDADQIHLMFVLERDHHPYDKGTLCWSRRAAGFTVTPDVALLQKQAQAYIASYLVRKAESSVVSSASDR
jgi:hypothetical protein